MLITTPGQVSTTSPRDFKNNWILQTEPKFSPLQSHLPVLCPSPIREGYYMNSSSLAFLDCQESSLCLTVCLSVCLSDSCISLCSPVFGFQSVLAAYRAVYWFLCRYNQTRYSSPGLCVLVFVSITPVGPLPPGSPPGRF